MKAVSYYFCPLFQHMLKSLLQKNFIISIAMHIFSQNIAHCDYIGIVIYRQ